MPEREAVSQDNNRIIGAAAPWITHIGADALLDGRPIGAFGLVRSIIAYGPGSGNPYLFDGRGMRGFGFQGRSGGSLFWSWGRYDETGTTLLATHYIGQKVGGGPFTVFVNAGEFGDGYATLGFFDLLFGDISGYVQTLRVKRIWLGYAN